jgi:hypothetical protein
MDLITVVTRAEQALNMLRGVAPLMGENSEIVETVANVVGSALGGAKVGAAAYDKLVNELNGVIADLERIKANGGVTGTDFELAIDRIEKRGFILDGILAKLKQ